MSPFFRPPEHLRDGGFHLARAPRLRSAAGFTLIEVLVALVLLAISVAIVFPVVIQQLTVVPPRRVAEDVRSIGMAVRVFNTNLHPAFPGDLEDLMFAPTAADRQTNGQPYTAVEMGRWRGAYLEQPLPEGDEMTGNALKTGYDSDIQYEIVCFDEATNDEAACEQRSGVFVAVKVANIFGWQFDEVNDIVDGDESDDLDPITGRSQSRQTGKLRLKETVVIWLPAENATMYYLVTPFMTR